MKEGRSLSARAAFFREALFPPLPPLDFPPFSPSLIQCAEFRFGDSAKFQQFPESSRFYRFPLVNRNG
jgi:hypothetical protein